MVDRGIGGTGDDLDSARAVIMGVLMASACWLVAALFVWIAL